MDFSLGYSNFIEHVVTHHFTTDAGAYAAADVVCLAAALDRPAAASVTLAAHWRPLSVAPSMLSM